ncbi:tol-pal system protein YbgF [Desulfovibrio piger]|uniref:Tol-pal system protein YbgF n=1 Tax=Desulfovibrio piger TaxID=901 RepID=A0A848C7R9_9BACT|nr:tol-pal system protein YbgF [Desulfovibrio piger]MCI7406623.1 tol-pal system protein YbgF [Desulfovibrio piger]NME52331.1 tol-pal system protein YbgF [Desulfovibrio piger]
MTSAAASRPAAGTASGAARAEKPAAVNDAGPAPGTDSPSGTATAGTSAPVTDEKAAYQAGLDLILSGRLDEGMARMQALLEQHPSGTYAANAEYWLGEALSSQGRNEEALTHFRNVEARYPRHHKNADALLRTGMILKQQGDTAGAGKVFRQVVQRFPSSAAADLIRKKGLVRP